MEFLAIALHELRTPLATIKNAVALIFDETAGPLNESQHNFAGIASRNVDKLTLLLNDFFLILDLESEAAELSKAEMDIDEVVGSVLETFAGPAKTSGIVLDFEPGKGPGSITADRQRIVHVLNNLVSNAIKFTPEGGAVTISCSRYGRDNNFILVSVKDSGIGIEKKNFGRIFEKFQQVDRTLTRKFVGSGLGLAICKRIIELHNGRIWVESELGRGSAFHFTLPAK